MPSNIICETCGYDIRENRRHEKQSDNECRIVEIDTERVVGWAHRRLPDAYRKKVVIASESQK